MPRRYYSSTAVATTLSASANNSTTSITVTALSGFPNSTPWTAILDEGTASEEVVEVTNVSGTTLTVTRGVDGTTGVSHNAGATFKHGVSGRDFDEANSHVNASSGVHGLTGSVVGTTDTQTLTNKTINVASNTLTGVAPAANPTFTGQVVTAAGTVSAPAITPTGDSNTGIFFPAADTVAIAEGGVEILRVNSSGQIEHPAGSAAAPAIVPTGDTNTGLWAPAADTLAVSTGGTERMRITSAGNVGIGTSSPSTTVHIASATPQHTLTDTDTNADSWLSASSANGSLTIAADGNNEVANSAMVFTVDGAENMRITSAGNVGIGTSSPSQALHLVSNTQTLNRIDSFPSSGEGSRLLLVKGRGSAASPTSVNASDSIGDVAFTGYDGSNFQTTALIRGVVNATPSAGVVPAALTFFTSATNSAAITEKMRIDQNGLITGTGTSLGAWTSYTPTLSNTWALGNGTTEATYIQIGKLVIVRAAIIFGSTTTFGGSTLTFSAPVNNKAPTWAQSGGVNGRARDVSASKNYQLTGWVTSNTIQCHYLTTNGEWVGMTTSVPFSWADGDVIVVTCIYEAA